jgi:hypothetical protein
VLAVVLVMWTLMLWLLALSAGTVILTTPLSAWLFPLPAEHTQRFHFYFISFHSLLSFH